MADGTQPSGSGTEAAPYQVVILDNLLWISTNSGSWDDKYFEQAANIDAAASSSWNSGAGFVPIGNSTNKFTGSYNGQGYIIDGLYINRSTSDIGFFGYLLGADIDNLNLTNLEITGGDATSGLCGTADEGTTIDDCETAGSITGGINVGGVVGLCTNRVLINNCSSTAIVDGAVSTGGFVGRNMNADEDDDNKPVITNCYATGNVQGSSRNIGGFVGWNTGIISRCYATGNAHGTNSTRGRIGGFVGAVALEGGSTGKIDNCYSRGNVTTVGDNSSYTGIGGFAGRFFAGGVILNCYSTGSVPTKGDNYGGFCGLFLNGSSTSNFWDTQTSGQSSSFGGTGKTTAEMKTQSTFTDAGWDFVDETANGTDDYWFIDGSNNGSYPWLIWEGFDTSTVGTRIEPNTKITIESGTTMDITTGNLVLESDATGDVSLIVLGAVEINDGGEVNAQRYLPGSAQAWHLLGTPVSGMAINGSVFAPGDNDDFYAWDEPSPGTWVNYKVTSSDLYFSQQSVNNGDNLLSGKAYLIAYNEANPTKTFSGSLNTGNVTFTLKYTATKDWTYYSGWNLISNPYSSAIDWYLVDHDESTSLFQDNYAYVYDPNKSGGEGFVSVNGTSVGAYIGPNQGFFVRAKSSSNNATFTFTNAMQTHDGGSYLKSSNIDNALVLRLSSQNYYDETTIVPSEESSFNRDRIDALKLYSYNSAVPQLYSISQDEINLAINNMPEMTVEKSIPLGVRIPVATDSYTISIQTNTNNSTSNILYLEDKVTNKLHKISEEDYVFTSPEGDINNRFVLHFGVTDIKDDNITDMLNIWAYNNQLNIIGEIGEAQLEIFDIQGRLMSSSTINVVGKYSEMLHLHPGVYIVRLHNSSIIKSKQIIIN